MKKTIAAMAILASASSQALIGPGGHPRPMPKNVVCVSLYKDAGGYIAGNCDQTAKNEKYGAELKDNGCAKDQAAMRITSVRIPMCPTYVQL